MHILSNNYLISGKTSIRKQTFGLGVVARPERNTVELRGDPDFSSGAEWLARGEWPDPTQLLWSRVGPSRKKS